MRPSLVSHYQAGPGELSNYVLLALGAIAYSRKLRENALEAREQAGVTPLLLLGLMKVGSTLETLLLEP